MAYQIGDRCMACHNCAVECPVGAIHMVHTKYEVDQDKCISCGHCAEVCNCGMAFDPDREPVPTPHERTYVDADLVVMGGGASGLIAAVRAAELSGKKVVVLEKAKKTGGNAWYSNNFMVHNSKWQQELGVKNFVPVLIDRYKKQFGDRIDPELIEKAVVTTGTFFDWLESIDKEETRQVFNVTKGHSFFFLQLDMEMPAVTKRQFYNLKCRDASAGPGAAGSYVIRQMRKRCEELGVIIMTQCKAEQLLKHEDGSFAGVLASDPGGEVQVNAKYGVLATGGWVHGDDLIRKYKPMFFKNEEVNEPIHRFSIPSASGDVVKLGNSIGAHVDCSNLWMNVFGPVHHPFSYTFVRMGMFPENLYLNMDGKRFFSESDFFTGGAVMGDQPQRIVWNVMDTPMLEDFADRLIEGARHPKETDFVYEAWVYEEYKTDLEEELETGTAVQRADTLEELAQKCGIDPEAFCKTIRDYNGYCESGDDPEFHKDPAAMRPVVQGPFYAFFNKMATDGAFGGALVNKDYQVVDWDKKPIPGLYATGDNSDGWGIKSEGEGDHRMIVTSELTWAVTSGFNAGTEIGELLSGT